MHALEQLEVDCKAAVEGAAIAGLTTVGRWRIEPYEANELPALSITAGADELQEIDNDEDVRRAEIELELVGRDRTVLRLLASSVVDAILADPTVSARLFDLSIVAQETAAEQLDADTWAHVVTIAGDYSVARQTLDF